MRSEVRPYAVEEHGEHAGSRLMAPPSRPRWPKVVLVVWIVALTVALTVSALGWYRAANGAQTSAYRFEKVHAPDGWQWRTPAVVDRARVR